MWRERWLLFDLFQNELTRVCRENIRCLRAMSEASGVSRHSDKHGKQIRGEYGNDHDDDDGGEKRPLVAVERARSSSSSPMTSLSCVAAIFVTALSGLAYIFL